MRKTYCDHCGYQIDDSPMRVEIKMNDSYIEFHDLCRSCMGEFLEEVCKKFFEPMRTDLRRKH